MAVVAGIDEAGYGPILGPLVVSAAAFKVPDDTADTPLWERLSGAVCRGASRRAGRIAVGDSKKLHCRKSARPLEHLERGALASVAALSGTCPATFSELLACLAPAAREVLRRYPWYDGRRLDLPRAVTATDLSLAANSLSSALRGADTRLLTLRCEPVLTAEFNRMVAATDNKTVTLLSVTGRLLAHVWRAAPPGRLVIRVDRQGGRRRYLSFLQQVFSGCRLKVVREDADESAYLVSSDRRWAEVSFTVSADSEHLQTALASMVSKYVRELFMSLLNGFWAERVPGVAATAGYYVDGRRFYSAIGPALRELGIDERMVYRVR